MKKLLAVTVLAVALASGFMLAKAATPTNAPGNQIVSPVLVPGLFQYIGGPLSSAVNAHGGTFTANSGSAVTVTDSNLTANSVVLFGLKTAGGTPAAPFLVTVTPGTGFTVNSGGSDTSVYNYLILG